MMTTWQILKYLKKRQWVVQKLIEESPTLIAYGGMPRKQIWLFDGDASHKFKERYLDPITQNMYASSEYGAALDVLDTEHTVFAFQVVDEDDDIQVIYQPPHISLLKLFHSHNINAKQPSIMGMMRSNRPVMFLEEAHTDFMMDLGSPSPPGACWFHVSHILITWPCSKHLQIPRKINQ